MKLLICFAIPFVELSSVSGAIWKQLVGRRQIYVTNKGQAVPLAPAGKTVSQRRLLTIELHLRHHCLSVFFWISIYDMVTEKLDEERPEEEKTCLGVCSEMRQRLGNHAQAFKKAYKKGKTC